MPSTGIMSDYLEAAICNEVLRNVNYVPPANVYLALFDADPGDDGLAGTEVAGGAYARKILSFGAPADGVISNDAKVSFVQANANWDVVAGWGVFDALAAGNLLFHGALEIPKYVNDGQTAEFEIGDLEITIA